MSSVGAQRLVERILEACHHELNQPIGGRTPRQRISVRKEVPLEIWGLRIQMRDEVLSSRRAREVRRRTQASCLEERCHLADGQAFGKGDRPEVHVAAGQFLDDLNRPHGPIEAVLTRLQPPALARHPQRVPERRPIADDARLGQAPADDRHRAARRNLDELFGPRPALIGTLEADGEIHEQRRTQGDEDEENAREALHRSEP
jgi:hypothetical protein